MDFLQILLKLDLNRFFRLSGNLLWDSKTRNNCQVLAIPPAGALHSATNMFAQPGPTPRLCRMLVMSVRSIVQSIVQDPASPRISRR